MLILAGDIGGTKTHLAVFRPENGKLVRLREGVFPSRDHGRLEEVLEKFLPSGSDPIECAAFGIAGPVLHGRSETTNLPWTVDAEKIGRAFGMPSVVLLNDLEAAAYGAMHLPEEDLFLLNPGKAAGGGNRCVIAAGTGLGEAVLFQSGARHLASASEGGHVEFAPRSPLEVRLLEYLWARFPRVSYERVLSGPGLVNLYQFFRDTGSGPEPAWLPERLSKEDPGRVITEAGIEGKSPACRAALDLFVSIYGAEAGNLALKTMAVEGVYVGGGIAPKILALLKEGGFMKAFLDKGRFAALMENIPVRIVLNPAAALLGAARAGLDHLQSATRP